MRFAFNDLDNGVWVIASGLLIVLVSFVSLYCNYNTWDTPKDLTTISTIAVAYFTTAVGKRILRIHQRTKREEALLCMVEACEKRIVPKDPS